MRLFILGLSFAFIAGLGAAQESETQDNVEAEESVEQRVVVTGSRLRRSDFPSFNPLRPQSPAASDVRKALEDPNTRVYAWKPESFAYQEVQDYDAYKKLSRDQKDNLRLITNPVVRGSRTIITVNADDILKQQDAPKQTTGKD